MDLIYKIKDWKSQIDEALNPDFSDELEMVEIFTNIQLDMEKVIDEEV